MTCTRLLIINQIGNIDNTFLTIDIVVLSGWHI